MSRAGQTEGAASASRAGQTEGAASASRAGQTEGAAHATREEAPDPVANATSSDVGVIGVHAVHGARAAAAVLFTSAFLRFLYQGFGSALYIEGGLAIALLMTEQDGRRQWVRYAVLAWIAWGLLSLVQATSQLGIDRGSVFGLAWAGGLAGLMFDDGDVRKTGAFFALSIGGLLASTFF